jgi:hypothetical protein
MFDRLDNQHFIAASLKLVRYALDLDADVLRKMFAHELKMGRHCAIKRKQRKHAYFASHAQHFLKSLKVKFGRQVSTV